MNTKEHGQSAGAAEEGSKIEKEALNVGGGEAPKTVETAVQAADTAVAELEGGIQTEQEKLSELPPETAAEAAVELQAIAQEATDARADLIDAVSLAAVGKKTGKLRALKFRQQRQQESPEGQPDIGALRADALSYLEEDFSWAQPKDFIRHISELGLPKDQTALLVEKVIAEDPSVILENLDAVSLREEQKFKVFDRALEYGHGWNPKGLVRHFSEFGFPDDKKDVLIDRLADHVPGEVIGHTQQLALSAERTQQIVENAIETGRFGAVAENLRTSGIDPEKQREIADRIIPNIGARSLLALLDNPAIDDARREVILQNLVKEHPEETIFEMDKIGLSAEQRKIIIGEVVEKNVGLLASNIDHYPVENFGLDAKQKDAIILYLAEHDLSLLPEAIEKLGGEERKEFYEAVKDIVARVQNSPSQSLQRIRGMLLPQLLRSEDPAGAYDRIEEIFEKNNLPTVGKTLRVFEVLNPKAIIEEKLENKRLSPTLHIESHRGRMLTIYKDLLGINIDSGNKSLREYLEFFGENQEILDKASEHGVESLDADEQQKFERVSAKIKTLYENSQLARERDDVANIENQGSHEAFQGLLRSLSVKEGQKVTDRLAEVFLKPIGLPSIEAALQRMDGKKEAADVRNRLLFEESNGELVVRPGDLLKGFDDKYTQNILQNGSVAKEFLGPGADSDATPLDTDVSFVLPNDTQKGVRGAVDRSLAQGYGEVLMLVRDRGQFQKTSIEDDRQQLGKMARARETKLELFETGGGHHYGIRTGFPSTEIDAFIIKDEVRDDQRKLNQLAMSVAENGLYIPIADADGKVLFTPEMYDDYRKKFFGGIGEQKFELKTSPEAGESHQQTIAEIIEEKRRERPAVEAAKSAIEQQVKDELKARGVEVSDGYAEVLTRAELYDTGSTGRGTNVSGSYDYDYILKLNAADIRGMSEINSGLVEKFGGTQHEGHRADQLRLLGVEFGGQNADIDIGFVSKSELALYESHDAVQDRLEAIGRDFGEGAKERVIANIVLAKKELKKAGAYKKMEQGGLGGLGVENWVLANGGDALAAFESFADAAFEDGALVDIKTFQERYKILDPGLNAKKEGRHDNFTENLSSEGYRKMAELARRYVAENKK